MHKVLLLIVEDDLELAEMYATKFKDSGFLVDVAHNGAEGYAKMKAKNPDLVLMDMVMPELSGLEAVRMAKADETIRNIPIIMLTNQSDDSDVKAAMDAGANQYILKADLTPSQVIDVIKDVLDSE
jgi:two-component system, OmpR family, phosphate regulon response regulator PhoB